MAKVGNLQQGYVGKLDGQVYYKGADGKTVVRGLTIPKNPKTLQQRVQRVIAKTVSENYKAMKNIADHSFEGMSLGFQCMNRFRSLNMQRIRERAAYLQSEGISLYEYFNFIPLGSTTFAPAAVYISDGTLNQVYANIDAQFRGSIAVAGNTYQDVINALGAQRGDQMTFVTVEKDTNGKFVFHYCRVILDPRNENGAAPLSSPFIVDNAIGTPNSRNNGNFGLLQYADNAVKFKLTTGDVAACGIIMSRRVGNNWLRSTCQLALSEDAIGNKKVSLLSAADVNVVSLDLDSEMYLNNAGVGGSEGSSTAAPESTTPVLSNSANIGGASQSIAGGSVSVTALPYVILNGSNLDGATFKMTKNSGADVAPTTTSASSVRFDIAGAAVGDIYRFYMDDTLKLTVSVIQAGGGGMNEG